MEEQGFQSPIRQNKGRNKTPFVVVGAVILVAILVGFLITRQPQKGEEKKDVVIEKKEPSPTEKPKIEKASVKVQVLNGTGTPGEAGVVVKALEEAGYKSENIKSGNAGKYDHSVTTVSARIDFEEIVNNIKDILEPTFGEITVDSSNLNADSEFDVIITTGGKLFETPTPSVTVTNSPTPSTTIAPTSTPSPTPSPTPTP
ncbi:MAG: LytR C-terminal domain-containing protein [bacterium]